MGKHSPFKWFRESVRTEHTDESERVDIQAKSHIREDDSPSDEALIAVVDADKNESAPLSVPIQVDN